MAPLVKINKTEDKFSCLWYSSKGRNVWYLQIRCSVVFRMNGIDFWVEICWVEWLLVVALEKMLKYFGIMFERIKMVASWSCQYHSTLIFEYQPHLAPGRGLDCPLSLWCCTMCYTWLLSTYHSALGSVGWIVSELEMIWVSWRGESLGEIVMILCTNIFFCFFLVCVANILIVWVSNIASGTIPITPLIVPLCIVT